MAIVIVFCTYSSDYAQIRRNIRTILDQLGNTADAYLLSANRPSYSIDAYTNDENTWEIDASVAVSKDLAEVPISISYGISNKFEVFTGIDLYNQSYNFLGDKIRGVGDANIGFKYEFQESLHFVHVFQALLKIPTASSQSQLGTGLVDWHFGVAQGFDAGIFGYELSLEFNLLNRRKFPFETNSMPVILKEAIQYIKRKYNYKYEPELILTISPNFDLSRRSMFYTGVVFERNLRLNYNTTQLFAGFAFQTSDNFVLSAGGTAGFPKPVTFIFSAGFSMTL